MRFIQAMLPVGSRQAATDALREQEIDFALSEASGREFAGVLFVPVEPEGVESVVDLLRDAGVEEDGYVAVTDVETIVSDRTPETDDDENPAHRVSVDELRAQMRDALHRTPVYAVLALVSAVLATAGLLLDSPTVITGSMVIAPLLGPAVAVSVGSIVGDDELVRRGLARQLGGLVLVIGGAAVFAASLRLLVLPEVQLATLGQVDEFSDPNSLTLFIALAAGVAAGLSVTAGVNTGLVGVAVAAAVVPPSGVVGLGLAYGSPETALGAAVLVLVNVLSINLTCILALWLSEYRPDGWVERKRARQYLTRGVAVLVVGLLVVSSVVALTTLDQRENAAFERDVRDVVAESDVRPVSLTVQYESEGVFREPTTVVLHADDAPSAYADALRDRILDRTGTDVRVVVYEPVGVSRGSSVPGSVRRPTPRR
ncbi:TIGR00341 family protein [Haloprofundus halobius]|uniref:TIGR00341 family protein n=1 Tax=Haloprofundus halobius TaxID=2876194 RepID=UPI001CCF100F|nr:TIGR00341 family protein [Haloprofundus halobius]